MRHHLTRDELAALEEVSRASKSIFAKPAKPNACIARNAKKLVGIKFLKHRKDGGFALTEIGAEALHIKNCIAGLHAVADGGDNKLDEAVANFLGRKGYIAVSAISGQFEITPRGRECLADIALNP